MRAGGRIVMVACAQGCGTVEEGRAGQAYSGRSMVAGTAACTLTCCACCAPLFFPRQYKNPPTATAATTASTATIASSTSSPRPSRPSLPSRPSRPRCSSSSQIGWPTQSGSSQSSRPAPQQQQQQQQRQQHTVRRLSAASSDRCLNERRLRSIRWLAAVRSYRPGLKRVRQRAPSLSLSIPSWHS